MFLTVNMLLYILIDFKMTSIGKTPLMQLNEVLQKQGLKKLPQFKFDTWTGLAHNLKFTCHVEFGLNQFWNLNFNTAVT